MADDDKPDTAKEDPPPPPPKDDKSPFRDPGMEHFHGSRDYEEKRGRDRDDD